jgi:cyclophilin family peptidyl-prolyl cis-trans isomerase
MPRKKQTVQKQKRQKAYTAGEMSGESTKVKPKGIWRAFTNYQVFAIVGVIAIGAGFLFTVILGNNSSPIDDDNGVRGEGVIRTTPEPGQTSVSGASSNIKDYAAPPPMTIDPAKAYTATFKTEKGDVTVALDAGAAPQAVNNFVFLAKDGFYDGTTFFRVVADEGGTLHFVQGGDPTGTGRGSSGYDLPYEETETPITAGVLAVAKKDEASAPNDGSQFFFTLQDEPSLEGRFTVFGRVTEGLDVLASLEPRDPQTMQDPPPGVRIDSIVIAEA